MIAISFELSFCSFLKMHSHIQNITKAINIPSAIVRIKTIINIVIVDVLKLITINYFNILHDSQLSPM